MPGSSEEQMMEREVVLDQPDVVNKQSEALRHAIERADLAEAELTKIKQGATASHRKDVVPIASRVIDANQGIDEEAREVPRLRVSPMRSRIEQAKRNFAKTP